MPGPASFAGKYPQFQNTSIANGIANNGLGPTTAWNAGIPALSANGIANNGLGPTTAWNAGIPALSANGGVGSYNPAGQRSDLASVLAGNPTMTAGMPQMGGGFQKPGGKPSIGTAGGGGKPSIGYGGGPSRAMWK